MTDFIQNLLHPLPNAVMTVIMGILVLYWLFVLISGVGLDDLDLGFDFDVDIPKPETDIPDMETETGLTDSEQEVPAEKSQGFFIRLLNYLNVGKVPFMLVLSTLKFFMWIGTLITTQFIQMTSWGSLSLFIFIPLFFISIFITRFATNPMVKFFKEIGYQGEDEIDFLGRSGKMLSTIQGDKIGSAEVIVDKNPIKLNVRSIDGKTLKYGDYILIADESEDKKLFLVSKEITIRNF